MGVEVLAAAVVAYLIRKAARVGRRADQEVDQALDAGMDRLRDLVGTKLRGDLALARLEEQAVTGDASERTQRRAADAIADAAEDDPEFAGQLEQLVKALANREVSLEEPRQRPCRT